MSYNGSGTFNINSAGQPVVTGTVISTTAFNALTADLGTGLSTALTKDGQTVATARIPFAAGINSSLVTDSTSTTTGSVITAGGVGVAKALFVGTTANIAGITTVAAGSAALPAIVSTTGTADTGLWFPAADTVAVSTAGVEALRIDTNGRIQTGGLTVVDSARISVSFDSANSTGVSYKALAGSGGTVSTMVNSSGTGIGSITCTNTNVAYNTSSDYRLKNTVAPMTGALDKVALLKPVTYKWNVDGSDGQGFIAHELQEVVEGCVTGKKDGTKEEEYEVTPAVPAVVDADGKETIPAVEAVKGTRTVPSYQGIDTSFLVATLTAAIQEQQALITALTDRIAALEAK